jgi:glutamate--cysteine ligase catalytic subunit
MILCMYFIILCAGQIELDDEKSMDHFESLQSTNWQTCRWKPPPPRLSDKDPHIGWRTEFRSMEVQLTDFENAAFTVFIVLVTRVLLAFDLSFYLPLSKVRVMVISSPCDGYISEASM